MKTIRFPKLLSSAQQTCLFVPFQLEWILYADPSMFSCFSEMPVFGSRAFIKPLFDLIKWILNCFALNAAKLMKLLVKEKKTVMKCQSLVQGFSLNHCLTSSNGYCNFLLWTRQNNANVGKRERMGMQCQSLIQEFSLNHCLTSSERYCKSLLWTRQN